MLHKYEIKINNSNNLTEEKYQDIKRRILKDYKLL